MTKKEKIIVFDTTLRDGEQVPGCQLNSKEKVEIAKDLEDLGVDVLEAGFPISSPGDFNSIVEISKNVKKPIICALSRAVVMDIDMANLSLKNAKRKRLSLIDSQDAIIGNPLYDVASLIDDVRIKMPKNLQDNLFKHYMEKSQFKAKDQTYLKNDFDILSVQRNLKILGIFVRLYKRDKKPNYLKYLPHTWSLLERRMSNPIFNKLNILFKKHLPLKKLKKVKI